MIANATEARRLAEESREDINHLVETLLRRITTAAADGDTKESFYKKYYWGKYGIGLTNDAIEELKRRGFTVRTPWWDDSYQVSW